MDSLTALNDRIHEEADNILYKLGLIDILNKWGIPHITGSYALRLMTWRDLDIYLETDTMTEAEFFILGKTIEAALKPVKMSYRNERIARTKGLPCGLYWGVYLGNERNGAWKIDVWAVDAKECNRLLNYSTNLESKLDSLTRMQILAIKSQCWKDPEYRRSYTSKDIYEAVLEKDITTIEGFRDYLQKRNKES